MQRAGQVLRKPDGSSAADDAIFNLTWFDLPDLGWIVLCHRTSGKLLWNLGHLADQGFFINPKMLAKD